MIKKLNEAFFQPASIAVAGASDDVHKPGGRLLVNLKDGRFMGKIWPVNHKKSEVLGMQAYPDPQAIGKPVDLAILALPARFCRDAIESFYQHCHTNCFIIVSAGFGELNEAGKQLEDELMALAEELDIQIVGPNCIGLITHGMSGVFTQPVPEFDRYGADLVSASGATAVFLMEAGLKQGLKFQQVFSVGNSMQIGVEEALAHLDETYEAGLSAPLKVLYLEGIQQPEKLQRHATSLIQKGCKILALKSGRSGKGQQAASSHTGAMATSDTYVDALFRKSGIARCYNRNELIDRALIAQLPGLKGNKIAVITHAGGPGVMSVDALEKAGFILPTPTEADQTVLLEQLHPGSSAGNPFDILATGTEKELEVVLDYCLKSSDFNGTIVIFGSPGLFDEKPVFELIAGMQKNAGKPVYTVIPSPINAAEETTFYLEKGGRFFHDESLLARAMGTSYRHNDIVGLLKDDKAHECVESGRYHSNVAGFLPYNVAFNLVQEAGITVAFPYKVSKQEELTGVLEKLKYPLVMKSAGLLHKSDDGGVALNLTNDNLVMEAFGSLCSKSPENAVWVQQQARGDELYIGIKREGVHHVLLIGAGGIYLEILQDFQNVLFPVNESEIRYYLSQLKIWPILKGARGKHGVDIDKLVAMILRLNNLIEMYPEIDEMDINPMMCSSDSIVAVDVRIKIGDMHREEESVV